MRAVIKSKRRLIKVLIIVACIIFTKKIIDTPVLTGSFYGTYVYEGYIVSIKDDGDFYIMNQIGDIYMKGNYERKSENVYYLSGNGFKDQQIILRNRRFQLSLRGKKWYLKRFLIQLH
jgi:hypothetical protein